MTQIQGYIGGLDMGNYNARQSLFEAKLLTIRDALRTAFDTDSGQTTKVGDIFRWQGNGSSRYGYGFQIRHHNAGTPTGHEWTLLFGWFNAFDYLAGEWIGAYNDTTMAHHFRLYNGGSFNTSVRPKMFVKYCKNLTNTARYSASSNSGTIDVSDPVFKQGAPTITGVVTAVTTATNIVVKQVSGHRFRSGDVMEVASGPNAGSTFTVNGETEATFSDINYTDHDDMTMAADFTDLTGYSPRTQLDNWMPSYTTNEYVLGAPLLHLDQASVNEHVELVYENGSDPYIAFYKTAGRTRSIDVAFIAGNIISPYNGADTRVYGAFFASMNADVATCGQITYQWCSARYHSHGGGGGLGLFTPSYVSPFTIENEKDDANQFRRVPIVLSDANEMKGYLRDDVGFVVGATDERLYQTFVFDSKYFKKMNIAYALPWHDQLGLPEIRWDLEPAFPID